VLAANCYHWHVRALILHIKRVQRHLYQTAKSFFAIVEPGSCYH